MSTKHFRTFGKCWLWLGLKFESNMYKAWTMWKGFLVHANVIVSRRKRNMTLHDITWHDIESSFLWCWSYVVQLVASTINNITIRFLCCSNRHREMVTLTQYSMHFLYSIVMEFSHLISIMIKTAHILRVCQSVFESVSLNGSKLTHFPFTREHSLQSLGCMSVLV